MTQTPTDALRLVPVPYVVLSEAAGLLDCEGYGPLALTLNNLLAAAPASPLPEAGQLSKNLGQLKSGQCSGISGELNPELFAENANKSEGKMRDDRTTELPDFLTALFDEWGEEDYGEAAKQIVTFLTDSEGIGAIPRCLWTPRRPVRRPGMTDHIGKAATKIARAFLARNGKGEG